MPHAVFLFSKFSHFKYVHVFGDIGFQVIDQFFYAVKFGAKLSSLFGQKFAAYRRIKHGQKVVEIAVCVKYGDCLTMAAKFREENGSIICRELLGIDSDGATPTKRTDEFYKKRPCVELVKTCAEIMDEIIAEKGL